MLLPSCCSVAIEGPGASAEMAATPCWQREAACSALSARPAAAALPAENPEVFRSSMLAERPRSKLPLLMEPPLPPLGCAAAGCDRPALLLAAVDSCGRRPHWILEADLPAVWLLLPCACEHAEVQQEVQRGEKGTNVAKQTISRGAALTGQDVLLRWFTAQKGPGQTLVWG